MTASTNELNASTRILVVDDLPQARRIVRTLLQRLGIHDVLEASGREDAVKILTSEAVDLMITDINLKDGTGIDLIKTLRTSNGMTELPVVVITSDPDRDHVVEGAKLGVKGFLIKPFDATRLRERIVEALGA